MSSMPADPRDQPRIALTERKKNTYRHAACRLDLPAYEPLHCRHLLYVRTRPGKCPIPMKLSKSASGGEGTHRSDDERLLQMAQDCRR
jgi:hypothetical protein